MKYLSVLLITLVVFSGCGSTMEFLGNQNRPAQTVPAQKRPLDSLPAGVKHTTEVRAIFKAESFGRFITGSANGQIVLWSGTQPQTYELLNISHAVDKMSYHDGKGLLAASRGSVVEIFDLISGKEAHRFDRLGAAILDIEFAPDGESILLGAADGKVYRWKFAQEKNARSLKERQTALERYNGPAVTVSSVAFHPNGRVFFSGDWDGGLNGWLAYDTDRHKGAYDRNLFGPSFFSEGAQRIKANRNGNTDAIDLMQLSGEGNLLFAVTQTGMFEVWKVRGMLLGGFLQLHSGVAHAIAVSPSGKLVATAGRDGRVVISSIRRLSQEEILARIDRSVDHEVTIVKEFPLANIRALRFETEETLIAGDKGGTVLALTVK